MDNFVEWRKVFYMIIGCAGVLWGIAPTANRPPTVTNDEFRRVQMIFSAMILTNATEELLNRITVDTATAAPNETLDNIYDSVLSTTDERHLKL